MQPDTLQRQAWQDLKLLDSAVRAAGQSLADVKGFRGTGVLLVLDVTVAPGVDTVQAIVEGKDPESGKYYTIAQTAAITATGTYPLVVYPGIAAVANARVSDVMPPTWRVRMVHSAGSNFTYSLGGNAL